jgi:hypothetical protein
MIAWALCASSVAAQSASPASDPKASATITFSGGGSIKIRGKDRLPVVEIGAGETANIQLTLPQRLANTFVVVQALDGGTVTESATIAADGSGSIAFQAGAQPGLYRVLLSARGKSAMVRFWVPNGEDSTVNQPALKRTSG